MRICIISLMKIEGPYILEWLAHWRNLGVTDFIIFSNDCFDGTDLILDRLDAMGVVQHLPNPAGLVGSAQFHRMALSYGAQLRRHLEADFTMICDVDEFLHIGAADGTLPGLLASHDCPDAVSFSEVLFGFGGREKFEEGLVTEQFRWASDMKPGQRRARRGVKTITKVGPQVKTWSNHRPKLEKRSGIRWLDGSGNLVPEEFQFSSDRGMDVRGRMNEAWLAHYTVRSVESMLLKLDRGDAVRAKRLGPSYAKKRSAAKEINITMLGYAAAIRTAMKAFLDDSHLRKLHDAAVQQHNKRIEELKVSDYMRDKWKVIHAAYLAQTPPSITRNGMAEIPAEQQT